MIEEITKESGTTPDLCFQCNKCTAGCPVAYEMDFTPARIIHALKLEKFDIVFNSKTIWICASCETCSTRCPQGIDIASIMDACRIISQRKNMNCKEGSITSFYRSALNNMRIFGRLYEVGLITALKLKSKEFTKDMDIGKTMFLKGKLKLLPVIPSSSKEMKKIFKKIKEMEGSE